MASSSSRANHLSIRGSFSFPQTNANEDQQPIGLSNFSNNNYNNGILCSTVSKGPSLPPPPPPSGRLACSVRWLTESNCANVNKILIFQCTESKAKDLNSELNRVTCCRPRGGSKEPPVRPDFVNGRPIFWSMRNN